MNGRLPTTRWASTSRPRSRALAVLLTVLMASAVVVASTSAEPAGAVVTPTHYRASSSMWLDLNGSGKQAFVHAWVPDSTGGRVATNIVDASKRSQGWWYTAAGAAKWCVTCAFSQNSQAQQGISDVFPGGSYVVATIERSSHTNGYPVGNESAAPGKGAFNDIWIASSNCGNTSPCQAWNMTNLPDAPNVGIIWPRLSKDGTKLAWAEQYGPAGWYDDALGVWRLKIANVTWSNGVPSLSGTKTYEPETGQFYEPYGFSPDASSSKLLFASSYQRPGAGETQIYSVDIASIPAPTVQQPIATTPAPTRLSGQDSWGQDGRGWWNFNEFAFYYDADHIIYGRTAASHINNPWYSTGGLDLWIMNADGTGSQRLTYFNEPWNTQQFDGRYGYGYTNAGGWAVDPDDPKHLLVSTCHDLNCTTGTVVNLNIEELTTNIGTGTGLTGAYYDNVDLTSLKTTKVDNAVNWEFGSAPPAILSPAMGANTYSISWTGSLLPYKTGSHSICAYTDDGAKVWVGGTLIVNNWVDQAANSSCGSVNLVAGTSVSVRMDMYNRNNGGLAKLYWKLPNQTTNPEIIPRSQLTP